MPEQVQVPQVSTIISPNSASSSTSSPKQQQIQQRVAIIGAGVAGCAAAGALTDYNIDFVVFDKNDGPGGLWTDNYPGLQVQSTFELYEYPCKKFPDDIRSRKDPPAPNAAEICDYLEEYITEKDMQSNFRFNSTIRDIQCMSETKWIIELHDYSTHVFTFVVICNGLVSQKPNKIKILGQRLFQENGGIIIHSSERRDNESIFGNNDNESIAVDDVDNSNGDEQSKERSSNKRVLVIGNGKSAVDAAMAAADYNYNKNGNNNIHGHAPIQLSRKQNWYLPRYIFGCIQYKWFFHTRLGSALLPRYYETTNIVLKFLHFVFCPIKWIIWRIMEIVLLFHYRLPYRLWPKLGTIQQAAIENSVLVTDKAHLQRLRKKQIDMRIGTIDHLEPGRAVFSDGTVVDVDVVILATGWLLSFEDFICGDDIFSGLDFSKDSLDFSDDGLWLYRNVLPSSFKGLAFIGSNTLTFINIFTAYIQAYWLAPLLAGERPWPTESHMKETVQREKEFKRKYYPKCQGMRGAAVELYMQHYHDLLFRDMNAKPPFRNCLIRPLANLVVPVIPCLMKDCLEPSPHKRLKKKQSRKDSLNEETC